MPTKIKGSDFVWNFASTGIIVLSGFILSTIIVAVYNPEILGIFNESYAYYTVLSQIAVLGIHTATLKMVAEYSSDEKYKTKILGTAITLGFFISTLFSIFALIVSRLLIDDIYFLNALEYAIFALPLFSLNKIALWYLNGNKNMRIFAVCQASRTIFLVVYLLIFIVVKAPAHSITVIFLFAEATVLVCTCAYFVFTNSFKLCFDKGISRKLFKFGIQIIPGNLVAICNTKADIICLGLLTGNDYLVGIYSFATLFAEGMYQIYMIFRKIINPDLTKEYYKSYDLKKVISTTEARTRTLRLIFSVILLVLVNIGFYLVCIVLNQREYLIASIPLLILSISIATTSKSIIYGNIFAQIGMPTKESTINILTLMANVVLNCILIPFYGIWGAAVATGISYVIFAAFQSQMIKRELKPF